MGDTALRRTQSCRPAWLQSFKFYLCGWLKYCERERVERWILRWKGMAQGGIIEVRY
jgi:hypothetical protein